MRVCVFLRGYKWEKGGQEREQNFLFCVVLCCSEEEHNKKGRAQIICLSHPPPPIPQSLFMHLLIRPCWMGRNGLEGEESHTDRWTTVWRCLSNREGERVGERNGESGPPEFHPRSVSPLFSFLFFGSRSPFSPVWRQRCPVWCLEKRVSVLGTAWLLCFNCSVCRAWRG